MAVDPYGSAAIISLGNFVWAGLQDAPYGEMHMMSHAS